MHRYANLPMVDVLEQRMLMSGSGEAVLLAPLAKTEGKPKAKNAPEITVLLNGGSLADGSATAVDFGRVTSGGSGAVRTFVIRNDGKKKLSVGAISLPRGFSLVDAPAGGLGKGESTTFAVRLDAAGVGARSGQIGFATNDADEGWFNFTLRGTVAATPPAPTPARVGVRLVRPGRSSLAIADGATGAIDFGTVARGATAPTRTFRVANEGGGTLTLGAVVVPAGFRVVEGLRTSLGAGQVDEFTVAMDTAGAADHMGQVRFTTGDAGVGMFNFAIKGLVTAKAPTPTPSPTPTPTSTPGPFVGGTLTVSGTSGDDVILFSGRSAALTVTINGRAMSGSPFAGVSKIVVNAGSGDDRVDLSPLFMNATANGGPGNDVLTGGNGNDVLNGDSGNDVLDGGPGDDHLLGGDGDDSLTGGTGVDALHGEGGSDVLNAMDGVADSLLDSGAGTDVLHRDRVDPADA